MKQQEFIPDFAMGIDHMLRWHHMLLSTKHQALRFPTRDLTNHERLDIKQQQNKDATNIISYIPQVKPLQPPPNVLS